MMRLVALALSIFWVRWAQGEASQAADALSKRGDFLDAGVKSRNVKNRAAPLAPCAPETFAALVPDSAVIESAVAVAEGGSYGEGSANPAYSTNPTKLPELCAVRAYWPTSDRSGFRFGLFLPTKWNNRFLAVGNGAFAGGINWLDMGSGVRYGFVTMSTDTGHNSTGIDLTWALNNSDTKMDFGFRALHLSVNLARDMVRSYYGDSWEWAYYSGCSTGGRQGLKEAQRYPHSFDGLLIGAPAWWTSHLQPWATKIAKDNLPRGAPNNIPSSLFPVISREAQKQCDSVDGVEDGIISAPGKCQFNLTKIQCGTPGVDASACLTEAQIQTAKTVYSDYIADGKFAFPGMEVGSEDLWGVLLGGSEPSPLGQDYIKYFLLDDPNWKWQSYNDSIVWIAEAADPGDATADQYTMTDFANRGNKMIMYHGTADGLIPLRSSTYLYEQVSKAMGGTAAVQEWFRYFEVPGMGHCGGTPVGAPWYFGTGNQAASLGTAVYSTPGFEDARHDALLALIDWVEKGKAVDSLIATTWKTSNDPSSGVLRQRPLCPFPQVAKLTSGEDEKKAESWTCQ